MPSNAAWILVMVLPILVLRISGGDKRNKAARQEEATSSKYAAFGDQVLRVDHHRQS